MEVDAGHHRPGQGSVDKDLAMHFQGGGGAYVVLERAGGIRRHLALYTHVPGQRPGGVPSHLCLPTPPTPEHPAWSRTYARRPEILEPDLEDCA